MIDVDQTSLGILILASLLTSAVMLIERTQVPNSTIIRIMELSIGTMSLTAFSGFIGWVMATWLRVDWGKASFTVCMAVLLLFMLCLLKIRHHTTLAKRAGKG